MNLTKIINITNKVALFSVGVLVYWVFIFICISVFQFKVFKENITQGFYFSIAGIFAILSGAIILNVMLNLTKISQHAENKSPVEMAEKSMSKVKVLSFFMSFPLIFSFLYFGDMASSLRKEKYLVRSCESLIKENEKIVDKLSNYTFGEEYVKSASNSLTLLSKIDENFPQIILIVKDAIDEKDVFLRFSSQYYFSEQESSEKVDYIFSTSKEDREYLTSVFDGKNNNYKFSAHGGNYEIYYPIKIRHKDMVFYLSDRQRYGKFGS